jgi:superfamily I DNA/RNA helicase
MRVMFFKESEFRKQLHSLARAGGIASKAHQMVKSIIGGAWLDAGSADDLGKLTKHGESRIKHAVKYDLPGAYRLVTIQQECITILVFVGTHDEAERWLNRNRGMVVTVNKETNRVSTTVDLGGKPHDSAVDERVTRYEEVALIDLISVDEWKSIGVECLALEQLRHLTTCCGEDEIQSAPERLSAPIRNLAFDVLFCLRYETVSHARGRIDLELGRSVPIASDPNLAARAFDHEINAPDIVDIRTLSTEEQERLLNGSEFEDWMLFLHPDQRRVAVANFDSPTFLSGVAGSGKTSVLVHRAKHLAQNTETGKIAVLTLNRSLACLLTDLVSKLCTQEELKRIAVTSIDDLFLAIVRTGSEYSNVKLCESIERELLDYEIWGTITNEPHEDFEKVVDLLKKRQFDELRYIFEEFKWIQSAFVRQAYRADGNATPSRSRYEDADACKRKNRVVALQRHHRKAVLNHLGRHERLLLGKNRVTCDMLASIAFEVIIGHGVPDAFKFRSILVDESQDLGTLELSVLRQMVDISQPNAFFCSGDPKQQIHPKHQDLKEAGFPIVTRRRFMKNYRNTDQSLAAALPLTKMSADDADERQDFEFPGRSSCVPLLVRANNDDDERSFVAELIQAKRTAGDKRPVCIVVASIHQDESSVLSDEVRAYESFNIPVRSLQDFKQYEPNAVYLSGLGSAKGFEFSLVVITQCNAGSLPAPSLPKEEAWRDANRLYVAMTRARDELILTHVSAPTSLLDACLPYVRQTTTDQELGRVPTNPTQVTVDPDPDTSQKPSENHLNLDEIPLEVWMLEELVRWSDVSPKMRTRFDKFSISKAKELLQKKLSRKPFDPETERYARRCLKNAVCVGFRLRNTATKGSSSAKQIVTENKPRDTMSVQQTDTPPSKENTGSSRGPFDIIRGRTEKLGWLVAREDGNGMLKESAISAAIDRSKKFILVHAQSPEFDAGRKTMLVIHRYVLVYIGTKFDFRTVPGGFGQKISVSPVFREAILSINTKDVSPSLLKSLPEAISEDEAIDFIQSNLA